MVYIVPLAFAQSLAKSRFDARAKNVFKASYICRIIQI